MIIEKDRFHTMNSETIGIDPNSAHGYNIKDVEYAMRLTYSGEFLHAAPWSVASQGHSNVSHGCTGMSTANAGWLYHHSQIGDVVEYTGSSKMMTLDQRLRRLERALLPVQPGSALTDRRLGAHEAPRSRRVGADRHRNHADSSCDDSA